jgi:hypothetical protein
LFGKSGRVSSSAGNVAERRTGALTQAFFA